MRSVSNMVMASMQCTHGLGVAQAVVFVTLLINLKNRNKKL